MTDALGEARGAIALALQEERFADAMAALARLRGPVDGFFNEVMVNVPDAAVRVNRLRLLALIRASLGAVADFGLIEDTP